MKFTDKLTFFYAIEEKIWNDKIEANQFLGTLSILFVAVLGAIAGGGNTLADFFDWDTAPSMLAIVATCVVVWGMNVGESIVASTHWLVALLRSVFMLVVMGVVFGFGYAASVIVIVIVSIILALLFFVFLIKLMLGMMTEQKFNITDSLGNKITTAKGSMMDSTLRGADGETYSRNSDGTVTKD
jgi:hypothetical protein